MQDSLMSHVTRGFVAGFALACMAALPASSCDVPGPVPPDPGGTGGDYSPTPPVTGGETGTGGEPSGGTGGLGTGGVEPTPVDDCEAAESHLQALNCRRATDGGPRWLTPAGTPLAVVCRARAADGDPICQKCIASVSSCAEVDLCRPHSPGVCP
jgi:hypothetical protein